MGHGTPLPVCTRTQTRSLPRTAITTVAIAVGAAPGGPISTSHSHSRSPRARQRAMRLEDAVAGVADDVRGVAQAGREEALRDDLDGGPGRRQRLRDRRVDAALHGAVGAESDGRDRHAPVRRGQVLEPVAARRSCARTRRRSARSRPLTQELRRRRRASSSGASRCGACRQSSTARCTGPLHAALDRVDLRQRAVLVVLALDQQRRRGHAAEHVLDVPGAELGREPDVVPEPERALGVAVVARPSARRGPSSRTSSRASSMLATDDVLDEDVRGEQDEPARPGARSRG